MEENTILFFLPVQIAFCPALQICKSDRNQRVAAKMKETKENRGQNTFTSTK